MLPRPNEVLLDAIGLDVPLRHRPPRWSTLITSFRGCSALDYAFAFATRPLLASHHLRCGLNVAVGVGDARYKERVASDPQVRSELEATLAARRELGPELEPHVIDAFVERIERRLDERLRERLPAPREKDKELALAIISLAVAIPLIAIAGSAAGLAGVVAVCTALVLVNYFFRS